MKKILLLVLFGAFTANAQTVALQSFATGFTSAISIEHPVNDNRLFVVQQGGLIRILNTNGTVNSTPFINLSSVISASGERGLLGLAFHPNYSTVGNPNFGYFFVNYTRSGDGATVIARYKVSSNPDVADAASGTVVLTVDQPFSNHNGGTIKFGPDGFLYIGMGDGGSSGDPGNRAQNIDINLGKMLRINVDALPYTNPSINPYFGATPGNDEIWAIGLRNPWKFSFNRLNGDLWVADVGQNIAEEVNKISSPLPNTGLNFGWKCYEGNGPFGTPAATCPAYSTTVAPVAQYGHGSGRCSITGGYFYTGSLYPNFADKYFFADYCSGEIGTIGAAGTITWRYTPPAADPGDYVATFGEDSSGELYVSIAPEYGYPVSTTIYKIVDSSLGSSNFSDGGLSMYPNPAKTEIFIKNTKQMVLSQVKIYDLTGKMILSKTIEDSLAPSVNISELSSGMYLVAVEDLIGNKYQSKLVVQ